MDAARIINEILHEDDDAPPRIRKFKDLINPFDGLSNAEIYDRYRFPPNIILEITDLINEDIEQPSKRSRAIPPLLQVCISLRYLASNSFQQVIGDMVNVAKSTCCRSLWRCLRALVRHAQNYIRFPSAVQEITRQKQKFYEIANFPSVIGLIDGTDVRILAPKLFENVYINRKSFHSLNVQGVCDYDGYFTNVTAKWPRSSHDSRVFNESELKNYLERNEHIGYLLGDSRYACKHYLLTPFLSPANQGQERYNISHKKTRVLIEQVFGRFKRQFSILHGEVRVDLKRVPMLIICCAILHNIAVKKKLPDFNEMDEILDDEDDIPALNLQNGLRYRDLVVRNFFD